MELNLTSKGVRVHWENTSDEWDIWWYNSKEQIRVTILYHAVETTVADKINYTMTPCILIGCIFYGMV